MVTVSGKNISELSEDDRQTVPSFRVQTTETPSKSAFFNLPGFVRGTTIATLSGEKPVQELKSGDKIITRDAGAVPLGWIGRSKSAAIGIDAPILVKAGSVGNHADLLVARNQCILFRNPLAELFFGTNTVLVPVEHMIDGQTIMPLDRDEVEYWCLMFDRHHVIYACGAMAETLYPAHETIQRLGTCGAIENGSTENNGLGLDLRKDVKSAARVLDKWEARLLFSEHAELMFAPHQGEARVH